MKVKYIGESFGAVSLTNGKIYECLGVDELDGLPKALRIIDDAGHAEEGEREEGQPDGYLYSAKSPGPLNGKSPGGRWEIVEDDEQGSLRKAIFG